MVGRNFNLSSFRRFNYVVGSFTNFMKNNAKYRKISLECAVCKTRFELWITETDWFTPGFVDYLRKNFHRFCPVCKALEELEKNKS